MSRDSLRGKVALVTGAAQGMGASHARHLAGQEAQVVLADQQAGAVTATADEIDGTTRAVPLDVTSSGDWRRAVEYTLAEFGRLDILVNNAGIQGARGSVETITEQDFRYCLDVNLVGTFLGMQATVPIFKAQGGGSIINIGSTAGLVAYEGVAPYVAAKSAIRAMTKVAAIDLAPFGIRVNTVHPGQTRTPLTRGYREDPLSVPVRRQAEPEEISAMVVFLASDAASFCTGADFAVDGGTTAGLRGTASPARGGAE